MRVRHVTEAFEERLVRVVVVIIVAAGIAAGVAVAVAVAVGVGRGELALDAPANVTKELGASAIAMQKKRRDGDAGRRRLLPGGGGGSEGISEKKYRPAVRSGGRVGAVEVLTWPPCTRWPSPRGQS